jgi:hypothetical protein
MEAWTAVRAKHLATKRGIAGELFFSNCFSVAFLPSYFVGILRLNIVFGGIKSQELLIRLGGGGGLDACLLLLHSTGYDIATPPEQRSGRTR